MQPPEAEDGGGFFVTGGTLRVDAPCYVRRAADDELLDTLGRGEYCYVLTARQLGKSSLMVRTASSLRAAGTAVAVLDLTAIGQNVTPEQWYDGLLSRFASQIGLADELEAAWTRSSRRSPCERFFAALTDVALSHLPAQRLAVFIDEVDAVRSLHFSADEFFAAIRECYNRRSSEPRLERLTFCLLGVASPSDLITDPRTTPFNIGRRIELTDFTEREALALAVGLRGGAEGTGSLAAIRVLRRVLYWTAGHPYLTQALCNALSDSTSGGSRPVRTAVDAACRNRFLSVEALGSDDNLLFVRDRLLRGSGNSLVPALELLAKTHSSHAVVAALADPAVEALRLAGVVRVRRDGRAPRGMGSVCRVMLRNRIYRKVFDPAWIRAAMPGAELRRQQAAFRRGLLRAGALGAVLLSLVGGLALSYFRSAETSRRHASQLRAALSDRDVALGQSRQDRTVAQNEAARATRAEKLEKGLRQSAESALHAARDARLRVEHEQEVSRRALVSSALDNALRLQRGDRPIDALPWLVEALQLSSGHADEERQQRVRIAANLAMSPRLLRVWKAENTMTEPIWSESGTRCVALAQDASIVWRDTVHLREERSFVRSDDVPGELILDLSRDGSLVLVGEPDGRLHMWRPGERLRQASWRLPQRPATLLLSPDRRRLVIRYATGLMEERDLQGGTVGWQSELGAGLPATFSPDGRRLAAAVAHGRTLILDSRTGRTLAGPLRTPNVSEIGFSPDGRRCVTTSSGTGLGIWDAATGREVATHGALGPRSYSPDGARLAVSRDRRVEVLSLETGKVGVQLSGLPDSVVGMRFGAGPDELTVVCRDGTITRWDLRLSDAPVERTALGAPVARAWLNSDLTRVVTQGRHGVVWAWDPRPSGPRIHRRSLGVPGVSPVLSSDGAFAAVALKESVVQVWRTPDWLAAGPVIHAPGPIRRLALTPDGSSVLAAGRPGWIARWDRRTGRREFLQPAPIATVRDCFFSPDARRLLLIEEDSFRIWDAHRLTFSSRGALAVFPQPEPVFSPDSTMVALARNGGAEVYSTGVKALGNAALVGLSALAFTGVEDRIVTGGQRGELATWELNTTPTPAGAYAHSSGIGLLAGHPRKPWIAVAGWDGTFGLWDYRMRRLLYPPVSIGGTATSLAFSADGGRLVIATGRTSQVWDSATGRSLSPPVPHTPGRASATFGEAGGRVLVSVPGSSLESWELRAEDRSLDDLRRLGQLFTGTRTGRGLDVTPLQRAEQYALFYDLYRRHPGMFTPTNVDRIASLETRVLECEGLRAWSEAAAHLDRLVRLRPGDVSLRRRAGIAAAEAGKWAAAERHFLAALALGSSGYMDFYHAAVAALSAQHRAQFTRICNLALNRLPGAPGRRSLDMAAWTCALGPPAPDVLNRALKINEQLLAEEPDNPDYLNTRGVLLYRAERLDEALASLQRAVARRGGDSSPVDAWFLAMVYTRLGRPVEAVSWRDRARNTAGRAAALSADGLVPWGDRAEFALFEAELRRLPPEIRSGETQP